MSTTEQNAVFAFDFDEINNLNDFYDRCEVVFDCRDFFGRNLDALYDVLTGFISLPATIRFQHMDEDLELQYRPVIKTVQEAVYSLDGDLQFLISDEWPGPTQEDVY